LSSDGAALSAYAKLVGNEEFKDLKSNARIALLSQVQNYPNKRSIENLERFTMNEAHLLDAKSTIKDVLAHEINHDLNDYAGLHDDGFHHAHGQFQSRFRLDRIPEYLGLARSAGRAPHGGTHSLIRGLDAAIHRHTVRHIRHSRHRHDRVCAPHCRNQSWPHRHLVLAVQQCNRNGCNECRWRRWPRSAIITHNQIALMGGELEQRHLRSA
jgi:hypothetical protein